MDSDAQLLERYASTGSEPAFTELVTRHINGVYRAALRQLNGNAALAEDVAQRVFTELAAKSGRLSSEVVLAGWLYTTTHYTVANVRRAEYRRFRREQEAYRMQTEEGPDRSALDWERLRPLLDEVLWSLQQRDREAVLLRFFEAHSYHEIGEALRVSEDAARMRVDRALEKLRNLLARREVSSTTAALATVLAEQTGVAAPAGLATSVAQHAVLAGATASTGSLALMASSKPMMIAAGACAALLVSSGVREAVALRAASNECAALTREAARLRVDVAEEEARAVASAAAAPTPRGGDPAAPAASADSKATNSGAAAPDLRDPRVAGAAFIARHPEVKRALVDYMAAGIRGEYSPLYRELQLTPEQIARFEAVLVRGRGFGRQVSTGTLEFSAADEITPEERTAELKSILGEKGYDLFSAYDEPGDSRRMAANAASLSIAIGTPMTTEQATALARTFAGKRRGPDFDWNGVLEEARGYLSPEHVTLVETLRDHAEKWQKVVEATR